MKKLQNLLSAFVLTLASCLVLAGGLASAADSPGAGNGMRVSPVRTDLVMQPGQTRTVSVFVQNVTSKPEDLAVIKNDFTAKDESGSPALLLNGETNDQHGLKKYITAVSNVNVAPGQQKEVKVTISLPANLAGGGYYGAIRFGKSSPGGEGKNLTLSGSVASLILVKVPGNVTEKMSLASFDVRRGDSVQKIYTSGKGLEAVARFQNSGNIQEEPFGKIILKHGGKILGTYEINSSDQPGNVLPDSIRRFSTKLKNVGFGKYTVEGNFGYGSNGQLLSGKTTFYVVPLWIIILVVALIVLVIFLIFALPRMIRRHDRNVIRKSRSQANNQKRRS